ncbi:hypothetical protein O3Q51_14810 [Cryomorphaceae bacterium 1068]|nr:hypothetical protein [Cryomorphaceae bacterium 1068]
MRFKFFPLAILLIASISFGFISIDKSSSDLLDQSNGGVFFSSNLLYEMMGRTNCEAIRFYSAKPNSNGSESVLAVCVSSGADMKVMSSSSTKYRLFSGIQNGTPSTNQLSKDQAAKAVRNVNGVRFAVTISNNEINALLKAEGCTGIEVTRATTQNGSPTFLLTSAKLSGNTVVKSISPKVVKGENPCPPSCGANLSHKYLSTISR